MISKEQAELLTAAKDNKIPLGNDFFYSNPLLQFLVDKKFIIFERGDDDSEHICLDTFDHEISRYSLTLKGFNALESYKAQLEQKVDMDFNYPLLVNELTIFIGYFFGFVSPFILHLIK